MDYAARPMIGTIGTAPAGEAASSLIYATGHGGNLDCPAIRPGSTVILPGNVPGALISLGDVHALMGDGEITGTALETSADVTIRIGLRKSCEHPLPMPRLTDTDSLGSIGCVSRTSIQDNIRAAVLDVAATLQQDHAIPPPDALQLINLFGKVVVNQAANAGNDGWATVLVRLMRGRLRLRLGRVVIWRRPKDQCFSRQYTIRF